MKRKVKSCITTTRPTKFNQHLLTLHLFWWKIFSAYHSLYFMIFSVTENECFPRSTESAFILAENVFQVFKGEKRLRISTNTTPPPLPLIHNYHPTAIIHHRLPPSLSGLQPDTLYHFSWKTFWTKCFFFLPKTNKPFIEPPKLLTSTSLCLPKMWGDIQLSVEYTHTKVWFL